MREFFMLILQYIHLSQLMCAPESSRFLSYNVKCLKDHGYFVAGLTIAMSLVHGGLAPHFLSPVMFQALLSDHPLTCHCKMSMIMHELKSSLESLVDSDTVKKAKSCTSKGNLSTVLELAGTLAMPIKPWMMSRKWSQQLRSGLYSGDANQRLRASSQPLAC